MDWRIGEPAMFNKLLGRTSGAGKSQPGSDPQMQQDMASRNTSAHDDNDKDRMAEDEVWPEEIRLKADRRTLEVHYVDGTRHSLSAEYLRVYSPSAEVRGHGAASERKIIGGKREVEIIKVEPVGNYAVRLSFDDLHNTGIFSWKYLAQMATEQESWWQNYLDAMQDKGLSRDR
jgi:DUF971 family protein